MRKNVTTLLFAVVFCMFFAVSGFAQRPPKRTDAAPPMTTASAMPTDEQIAGGYATRKTNDKAVVAAVKKGLALKNKEMKTAYKLGKINAAESQVVAGTNYKVCLSIYVLKKGKKEMSNVNAVIYQDLKNVYQVTSWEEIAACE
ncbi:MAG TPA: cystatin domain-containing protein [Pyrinomonadaceae bacterium]|nr:cystatin domain-containing protein [Pyrinomonadaceae bacterium]